MRKVLYRQPSYKDGRDKAEVNSSGRKKTDISIGTYVIHFSRASILPNDVLCNATLLAKIGKFVANPSIIEGLTPYSRDA